MNSKKVSLFGKMAVSSVLALSTAAGVVVAPQMGAVANAATATYAEREVNVEFGNGSNMLYTMNIKIVTTLVDENGNESPTGTRVKATYVYHLTKAPNEKPYLTAIQLVPVNFNGMSQEEFKQALTIVRGQVYNGEENNINAMSPIGPEYKNYQQVLNSVVTGQYTQSSDATKLPIGFTAIKNSTNEGDFWVVNVIADADKFNENSYVDLHVKGLSPWNDQAYSGLNIQLKGANEANTGIYQASNNEAGLKVNQSMASAAGGNNLNLATDVIKAAKENEAAQAAQAAAKAALEDAQANASKVIDKLPNLTDAEKAAAKAAVNAAGDIAGVIAAVADAAKKDIDENKNLTDAEKAAAKADVDAAVAALPTNAAPSEAALTTVVQPAIDANHTDEQKLADAKAAAKEDIDALPNLSDKEKEDYKNKVDAQTTVDGVIDVVAAAAKADIDANDDLSDSQKDDAKKAVDEAAEDAKEGNGDVTDVTKPADDASKNAADEAAKDALKAAQATAAQVIDKLPNLTDAEKKAAKDAVKAAGDIAGVIAAVADAAKKDIDENKNLTDAEKAAAKADVDAAVAALPTNAAPSEAALTTVVQPAIDANHADEQKLADAKAAAKEDIDALPNLSDKEKEDFKNQVDAQTTVDGVIDVVAEAAKADIDANDDLSDSQKDDAKKAVDEAAEDAKEGNGDVTDVTKPADDASKNAADEAAKDALEAAQANASKVIDKLPNLTDAEKQAAKDAAKAAGDIAGVIAAVAAAAKKDIDENQNLTDAEKAAAKADVDAAVAKLPTNAAPSEAALTTVVQPAIDANSADEQKLADAKAAAKKDIDELKNLSDNQKDAYKKQVDAQTTVDGVIDVVAAAAKADIDANSNLNDTEKDDAKKAVDEAADNAKEGNGDVTDVTKPADNAGTSTGTNTDADSLAAFKDAAKAKIDALGHLTDAQKDAYKALIDSANTIPAIIDIVAVATKADIDANSTLTSDEKQAAKDEVDQAAADAKQNAANGNTGTGSLDNVVAPADKTGSISGDTAELDKLKADAVAAIEGMEYLRPGQKEAYIDGVNSARTTATIISIVREAARTNVDQNPTLTADEKAAAKAQIDGAATIGDLEAYAGTQHGYSDGEVTNNNTTTIVNHTNGSSSSKVPWWVYLLTILGIGGGVASWGYVHDADFRAVVDGAIANFQRAVDNALGIRR